MPRTKNEDSSDFGFTCQFLPTPPSQVFLVGEKGLGRQETFETENLPRLAIPRILLNSHLALIILQGPGFSSSHGWMWEQNHKESWALKNWCFWTVAQEKILESPLDFKEAKPVHSNDQSWIFIGRTDTKAEAPILWPPDVKNWVTGKDPDAGKNWRQERRGWQDEMVGWHHQLDGRELEQALRDGEGQGSLASCSPRGLKESDTTERLNNNVQCEWGKIPVGQRTGRSRGKEGSRVLEPASSLLPGFPAMWPWANISFPSASCSW